MNVDMNVDIRSCSKFSVTIYSSVIKGSAPTVAVVAGITLLPKLAIVPGP